MNTAVAPREFTNSLRPQSGPDTRFIQFQSRSVPNRLKSKEAGRPVFEQRVFITIQHPGDNLNVLERYATTQDEHEFPAQWRAFQEGRESIPEGTLLSVLFPMNPEIVDNLRHFKVFTIEQLAGLTDSQKQSIGMGGVKMSQDAQAYLKAAASGADFHKLRDDVNKLMLAGQEKDTRIKALEGELARRDAAARSPQPSGQGVPQQPAQAPRR